jgi:hypothetical protein
MEQVHLDEIKAVVREEIKLTVNGKIDAMNLSLQQQIEQTRVIIETIRWLDATVRFFKWTGIPIVVVVAWLFKN